MDKVTEKLADFIINARYNGVPQEVLDVTRLHIMDTLECVSSPFRCWTHLVRHTSLVDGGPWVWELATRLRAG